MADPHTSGEGPPQPGVGPRLRTFLFADIEGSTRLLRELGPAYERVLAGYYAVLRSALAATAGTEVTTEGDGYFAVFDSARGAVTAAVRVQRELAATAWPADTSVRARIGLHAGESADGPGGPVGLDVHRAARIAAAAHGGQVLVSDAVRTLVEHHLPDGVVLRDLGRHRLKDLAEPQHLFQLAVVDLLGDFPPIRTLDVVPTNLPHLLTSFVGRERELAAVQEALTDGRLVTLTGPGGTGKTRLALQSAACLLGAYPEGVWFVALAPIRDPGLLPATVLGALRVPVSPQTDPRAQLIEHFRHSEALLVLDNFEQVLDAAPLVSDLLQAAPKLRVLVTSRSPLHLSGEQELPVPTLATPDVAHLPALASLSQYEAVDLFVQRARAARPDFAVTNANAPAVAEITARLDGLPLAIELAAARVNLLPPEAMLARLERRLAALGHGPRDLPERQQTLRRTIAWSYDLLSHAEQRLLACLGVFVDGWTLEQAEAVCEGTADALDGLAVLLDHSLVRQREDDGAVRFGMLETIREFALERLDELPDAHEVRDRHAAVFVALAEDAAPHLLGRAQVAWVGRLDREVGNLRAALDHLVMSGDGRGATRLATALWRYWQKAAVQEGRERIAAVLALDDPRVDAPLRSAGLEAAGGLAYWGGDVQAAVARYQEALELERSIGRPAGIANSHYNLAMAAMLAGTADAAWRHAAESLRLSEEQGDAAGAARARWALGCAAYFRGAYDTALPELRASLSAAQALDDVFLAHWARHMLGITLLRTGDTSAATPLLKEALEFFADVGDLAAVTLLLDDMAVLAEMQDRPERQFRLAAASHALQRASGSGIVRASAEIEGRAPVDHAAFTAAWQEGLALDVEGAVRYALSDADVPDAGSG
jgi:predicted ATPase/class 3 adenylate cyclase